MVLLTTTPTILSIISSLPSDSLFDPEAADAQTSISHGNLIKLSKLSQTSLNTLLKGAKPYHQPPQPASVKSPEYVALMARLRAEQEAREYRLLLQQRAQEQVQTDTFDGEGGDDDISPSLVLNMLLSVIMCAWVAFYTTKWLFSDGVRVLCALGTGVIVGAAEVTVYAAYLRKVSDARRKERRKREIKTVLGEFKGGDGIDAWGSNREAEEKQRVKEVEKSEQVWGRGIHRGIRRRVREKWEREQAQAEEPK